MKEKKFCIEAEQTIDLKDSDIQGVTNMAYAPLIYITIGPRKTCLSFACPPGEEGGIGPQCVYKRVMDADNSSSDCRFCTHCSGCINPTAQEAAIMRAAKVIMSLVKERVLGF